MKMIYLVLIVFLTSLSYGQSKLVAGDIAIVLYNADSIDGFGFVCLTTIDSGTEILFTDNGWYSGGGFRATEGTFSWIASSSYGCGDVIVLDSISPMSLSASGDQILAYQDSSGIPLFITALNNDGAGVWQATASNANNSALPSGLSNGVNAIALTEQDNAVYVDSLNGSLAFIRSKVFNSTSFAGNNTSPYQFTSTFNLSSGCYLPVHWLSVTLNQTEQSNYIEWCTAQEWNNDYYSVQFSLDGKEFQSIAHIESAHNSTEVRCYAYSDLLRNSGYYRLRQIDFNGMQSFSPVVVCGKADVPTIQSFHDGIYVHWEGALNLTLLNLNGQILMEAEVTNDCLINTKHLSNQMVILKLDFGGKTKLYKHFINSY